VRQVIPGVEVSRKAATSFPEVPHRKRVTSPNVRPVRPTPPTHSASPLRQHLSANTTPPTPLRQHLSANTSPPTPLRQHLSANTTPPTPLRQHHSANTLRQHAPPSPRLPIQRAPTQVRQVIPGVEVSRKAVTSFSEVPQRKRVTSPNVRPVRPTPPTHTANSHRQLDAASPLRQARSAKLLRQVTPPSHPAKSPRQVTPPSHPAKSPRQVAPPTDSANLLRALAPPRPVEGQHRHSPNLGGGWSRSPDLARHSGAHPSQLAGLWGLRSPTWLPSLPAYRRSSQFNPGFPDGTPGKPISGAPHPRPGHAQPALPLPPPGDIHGHPTGRWRPWHAPTLHQSTGRPPGPAQWPARAEGQPPRPIATSAKQLAVVVHSMCGDPAADPLPQIIDQRR
jgi:hypothetical protein